jgi:hypothetical protein
MQWYGTNPQTAQMPRYGSPKGNANHPWATFAIPTLKSEPVHKMLAAWMSWVYSEYFPELMCGKCLLVTDKYYVLNTQRQHSLNLNILKCKARTGVHFLRYVEIFFGLVGIVWWQRITIKPLVDKWSSDHSIHLKREEHQRLTEPRTTLEVSWLYSLS